MGKLDDIYSISPYRNFVNRTYFDEKKVGSPIYGEITQFGANNLINYFREHFNNGAIFYDLGCGIGKLVAHVGTMGIKKSIGIEYSKERYKGCCHIKNTYCSELKNIEFYNKSYFEHDFSDATIIYIDNTCCSKETNKILYDKVPKGCLFLFKSKYKLYPKEEILFEKDLVERTYKQNSIYWLIKE